MNHPEILVADIGGTRARFALANEHGLSGLECTLAVADYLNPIDAIRYFLNSVGNPQLHSAALAIAAPVDDPVVRLTNGHWHFSREDIRSQLGLDRLLLLNDFTALALSLPHLKPTDMRQLGGGAPVPFAPKAVLGPGTGLGTSGLIFNQGSWIPLTGEGGHNSLAPANSRESEILAAAWQEFPHVSFERLVSGSGLPLLHRLVASIDGSRFNPLPTAEIVAAATSGRDECCISTLNTFCAMLGSLAGNLALTLGARGGVYIGGGVVPRLGNFFDRSPFRDRFESKGRFMTHLATIPVYIITAHSPALLGAAQALTADRNDKCN